MMTATGKRRSELTVMNDQKRSEPARASIDACYHATRLASTSRGSLVSRRAADRHGNWAALLPLPAAPDPLVTGLAFLLLARLVLERSAQAGGLSLLLRHGCHHGPLGSAVPAPPTVTSRRVGGCRTAAVRTASLCSGRPGILREYLDRARVDELLEPRVVDVVRGYLSAFPGAQMQRLAARQGDAQRLPGLVGDGRHGWLLS